MKSVEVRHRTINRPVDRIAQRPADDQPDGNGRERRGDEPLTLRSAAVARSGVVRHVSFTGSPRAAEMLGITSGSSATRLSRAWSLLRKDVDL